MVVTAIIVAAGNSRRMGKDKLFHEFLGVKTIIHTINAFESCDIINNIVVVASVDNIAQIKELVNEKGYKKLLSIVFGGDIRQQSVINGVEASPVNTEIFAIHDGARPLITSELITKVVEDAWFYGAAALSVPVKETIKIADDIGFILSTPQRSSLYNCQTPQVFKTEILKEGIKKALVDGAELTDDCQFAENIGKNVYLSKGDYENIKLTTSVDIILAQVLFERRKG